MNPSALTIVTFGEIDELKEMVFENAQQHTLFRQQLALQLGVDVVAYPIMDIDPDNLDDWLSIHYQIHQDEDRHLGLSTPINLLDTDWNKEADFYEWLSSHASSMAQRAAVLGL